MPMLNPYMLENTRKDDTTRFVVLSKGLVACSENPDEKQLRNLYQSVLPKLFLFSGLPVAVVAPLFTLFKHLGDDVKKDHKKLLRLLFYELQLLMGIGRAGSPGVKDLDENINAGMIPINVLRDYWNVFAKPSKDLAQWVRTLCLMTGIVKGVRGSTMKKKQDRVGLTTTFSELLMKMLSNDYHPPKVQKKSIFKSVGSRSAAEEDAKTYVQRTALLCVRCVLPPKERKKLRSSIFNVLRSGTLDGITTRHLLALAVDTCSKSTDLYIQELKFRLEATLEAYGASGHLFAYTDAVLQSRSSLNGSSPPLLLGDILSRKYLAQGCGVIVQEIGKDKKNIVFWNTLVLLACHDPSLLVSFEAMRALTGVSDPLSYSPLELVSKTKPKIDFIVDLEQESHKKSAALQNWQTLMKEPVPIIAEDQNKETLLGHFIVKLREVFSAGNHTEVAGACRVVCDLSRCFAYAMSENRNQKLRHRSVSMLAPLRSDLVSLATSAGAYPTSIQSLALKGLIWMQGIDGGPLTPSMIVRILSNGMLWSAEEISDIMQTLYYRLVTQSNMSAYILDCVNAVCAGNPVHTYPVDLVDFWFRAIEFCDKSQVLNAALQFLESPLPPRALLSPNSELGLVSESSSAWRKLTRTVTLWLGNAAAFFAEDNPWQDRQSIGSMSGLSTADVLSTEVTQSPLLMSTISHFVHDLSTRMWESRIAAAKALSCMAICCQEPYRIQIYSVFKEYQTEDAHGVEADTVGLSDVISKTLSLLDQIYSGQILVDEAIQQWGGDLQQWPEEMAESLKKRHGKLLDEVLQICQVPTDLFFPLGPKSRALILGEGLPEPTSSQNIGLETQQLQYTDFLRQGSHQIEDNYDLDYEEQEDIPETYTSSERTGSEMEGPSLKEMITQSPSVDDTEAYPEPQQQEFGGSSYSVEDRNIPESPFDTPRDSFEATASPEYYNEEIEPEYEESSYDHENYSYDVSPAVENPFQQRTESYDQAFQTPDRTQIQEGYPRKAAVLFDFEAEMEGELTVNIGDIIEVLSEIEGGWYFATVENVLGIKSEVRCSSHTRTVQFRTRLQNKRFPLKRNALFARRQVLQLSLISWILSRRNLASASEDISEQTPPPLTSPPVESYELTEEEAERLMQEEDERRRQKKSRKGRLRELEETQAELAQKELELLQKQQELHQRDQSLLVLQEELELERKIRALLTREKEQANEEAALARGLCAGANMLP
eukprot:g3089.t1